MERDYEGLLILDPTLSDEAVEKEAAKITAFFPEGKATCQILGRKKFAYPIKKQTQGHYLVCLFKADGQKKAEQEQAFRDNPALLRCLVIKALRLRNKNAE